MSETSSTPFFMTHHSPVGAWCSFTFGLPGRGVSIDQEDFEVKDSADLLVAISRGPGRTVAMPFVAQRAAADYEGQQSRDSGAASGSYRDRWQFLDASKVRRTLTPCVDEFASDELTLRVYTPHSMIPNPKRSGNPQFAIVPGLLLELTVDNRGSDQPASGFIGLGYRGQGRIRPMDWSTIGQLCGVGYQSRWALAAMPEPNAVFTVRDNHVAEHVELSQPAIHNGGNEGGILIRVAPREMKTIYLACAFYSGGAVTQGIEGTYYYARFFSDLETVARFILRNAARIKESCEVFDKRAVQLCPDAQKRAIFAQAVRAYNANTQLIESNGIPYYTVIEGQFCWRNTLDVAVDMLPWELYRNPWVVRNVFDLYSAHYSYRDEVTFPGDEDPGQLHPGGLSYCHDVGSYSVYTPESTSGYELPNRTGLYSFATTEELLNGIYLLTSYALMSDDEPWSRTRLATARELLDSLEARDHYDPARRDGIMKGESSICGPKGTEITTYDALDPSLRTARGNLVLAIKTWCANLLLTAYFQQHNDPDSAQRAYNMAHLTAGTLVKAFNEAEKIFPANIFTPSDSRVIAALEPMAVPAYCNLLHYFDEFPELMAKLKQHAQSCLQPGVCVDAATGGLKLSSASENSWPSKTALCVYVLEEVLGLSLAEHPAVLSELLAWTQTASAEGTIADQIHVATRAARGGFYYPRAVSSAVWLKRPVPPPAQ